VHAPTALRKSPLPCDVRHFGHAVFELALRVGGGNLRPRHGDVPEVQGDERRDVDFELPDYGGRKGRIVERAHELKSGVKLSTWVTTRQHLGPRQDEALNHAEAERDLLLGAWA
jgi:hypothetical protein